MDTAPDFNTPDEEISYWREAAHKFMKQRDEAREELNEFTSSSKELEVELETQLQQTEKKLTEYRTSCNRLQLELDAERERLQTVLTDRDRDFENIHKELCQIKHMNSGLMRHVQDLEQKNDDLERAKRSLAVSLNDFEDKLNMEMERNAILEVELGEKDRLSEMVQRLKDEVRDLRSELQVKASGNPREETERKPPFSPTSVRCICGALQPGTGGSNNNSSPEKPSKEIMRVNRKSSESDIGPPKVFSNGATNGLLTPSARISALNIVGDLLRKVGALESKLASCRSYSTDVSGSTKLPSKLDPQRFAKRIPRGTSTPNVQSLVRAGSTTS